ncbi:MAG: TolC family protein [Myxococcales bacterium]|nr:TolC family protein [Myxococcales bacterium]MCB9520623.1 TolC family protein [Myxococcales bacterium]MCB9534247.1 TolC family protein [Myxococcales bacterium]
MKNVTSPTRLAPRALRVCGAAAHALLVASVLSAPSAALATEPDAAAALTFDAFVSEARASAPNVRLAELDAAAAAARERLVTSYLMPRLDASLGVVRHDREIGIDLPVSTIEAPVFQYRRTVRAAADARVALLDVEALAERRAAAAGEAAADGAADAAESDAARAAVEVFAAWAEVDARRAIVAETRQVLEAHRERVEARVAAGDATPIDVDRARTAELDAALAEEDLRAAEREVLRAAAALLGRDDPPRLVGELGGAPAPTRDDAAVRAAASAEAAARAHVDASRASWAPRVVASAGAAWTDTPAIDGEHASWDLGAALQWSLFVGRPADLDQRRAALDAAAVRADEAQRASDRAAAQASDDVEIATRRLELLSARAEVATDAAALSRVALAEGAISPDDALDAELAAHAARVDLAAGEVALARASWLAALGGSPGR